MTFGNVIQHLDLILQLTIWFRCYDFVFLIAKSKTICISLITRVLHFFILSFQILYTNNYLVLYKFYMKQVNHFFFPLCLSHWIVSQFHIYFVLIVICVNFRVNFILIFFKCLICVFIVICVVHYLQVTEVVA